MTTVLESQNYLQKYPLHLFKDSESVVNLSEIVCKKTPNIFRKYPSIIDNNGLKSAIMNRYFFLTVSQNHFKTNDICMFMYICIENINTIIIQ